MISMIMALSVGSLVSIFYRGEFFNFILSIGGAAVFSMYIVYDLQMLMGDRKLNINPEGESRDGKPFHHLTMSFPFQNTSSPLWTSTPTSWEFSWSCWRSCATWTRPRTTNRRKSVIKNLARLTSKKFYFLCWFEKQNVYRCTMDVKEEIKQNSLNLGSWLCSTMRKWSE